MLAARTTRLSAAAVGLRGATLLALRSFHSTNRLNEFHFDTHHFVQRLEREGLTRQQAEGVMNSIADVIDESIRNMSSNLVTKADQEKVATSPTSHTAS
jgi:hypothetical protein